jgi:hypothetical protein
MDARRNFEQNFHVHHRLGHSAGRRMDNDDANPDAPADAIVIEIGKVTNAASKGLKRESLATPHYRNDVAE